MAADITTNLQQVKARVKKAAQRAGRDPEEVTLVAVTKNVPPERINAALAAGITHLGENRVQEAQDKCPDVAPGATWHFVGHLQRNKVKDVLGLFDVVQSVDRLALAWELEKRAKALGRVVRCLAQVNVGEESSKFGLAPGELPSFLEQVTTLPHLTVEGLMTIAPFVTDPEEARPCFRRLRELKDACEDVAGGKLQHLSMGMTNDFEVAVEEGASIIRVGTAIFGERPD